MTVEGPVPAPTAPEPTAASAAATTTAAVVPLWLLRLGALGWRVLVIVAFVVVLALIAGTLATVTASVAVAFLAGATVEPLIRRLRDRGWGSGKAAAVGTGLVFGIVVLVLAVGAWVLVRYGAELVAAAQEGLDDLQEGRLDGLLPRELASALADLFDGGLRWLKSNIGAIVGDVANVFTILLFGGFTTFYVLQDYGRGLRWVTQGMSEAHRAAATAEAQTAISKIGGYIRRVGVLATIEAAIDFILLLILGVPLALPLATLVFVGGFIPYLGGLVATGVVLLVALASVGPEMTGVLLGLIVVANIVTDRLIAQPLQRVSAAVNPAIVLIALPIGAAAGGLFGLVMAVPVAAALLAVGTSVVDIVRPEVPDAGEEAPLVPPWLDLLAQWSWRLLVGIGIGAVVLLAILQVPVLILPLIIATVLAATFAPIVGALVRRGWGRSLASAVITVGVTSAIAVVVVLAIVSLASNVDDIAREAGVGSGMIDDLFGGLAGVLGRLVDQISGEIAKAVIRASVEIAVFVGVLVVGVILTFFFLRDGRAAWETLTSQSAPWRRHELDGAGGRAVGVLGNYMLGTGAVSLFGAATQLVLMVVLGVPLALPVFVLSFFGGYIPYFGSMITTGIALLLTITTGDMVAIAVMVIFTMVFNIVQGNVVQPLVFSRAVSIHPAIILLAIPAGGALGGILGMFLVVPVLGVVATTWRTVLVVLGRPPAEDEEVEAPGAAGAADMPTGTGPTPGAAAGTAGG